MAARTILVTDIDGTMLGDDSGLDELLSWRRRAPVELEFVYASGRFFESVVESIQNTKLPEPLAVIGGVGTEIRLLPSGKLLAEWRQRLLARNDWNSETIVAALDGYPGLEIQPPLFQSSLKVSYFLHNAAAAQLDEVSARVIAKGVRPRVVYSSRRDLDFLPQDADKGKAAAFLLDFWNVSRDRVIVSGDSGNDLSLFDLGARGIAVGNAHPELKALAGPRVYLAHRPCAAGVLDGLRHWLQ